jgi:hypothetical protein
MGRYCGTIGADFQRFSKTKIARFGDENIVHEDRRVTRNAKALGEFRRTKVLTDKADPSWIAADNFLNQQTCWI